MNKLALSLAALFLIVFINFIYEKLSGPTRFVVTADTKIIPGSELSKYVTQEEIDDFAFRYWDIDKQIKDDAFAENFRKLLKSKQTDQILKFMQDNNISIDSPLIDGVTPLMYASFYDDEATAKRLIDMGANAHAKDNYKLSPLAYAIENNSTKTAKLLLDSGVKFDEVKAVQYYIDPPFYNNIEKLIIDGDDVKIVFRDNYQVNKESKDANNPMRYIVWHNYVEMADIVLASGYKPKLKETPSLFTGIRDENSTFLRSLYVALQNYPNYEPMLELLLKYDIIGQPTKEELKKAYEECYKSYRWHIDNWKEEIDKKQTIPILIRMSIKNGERYCPDKDGAFSDTYTFIRWANEKKKLKSMISFWDTLKDDPNKVIYIDSNRSKSDSNSNLQSK
nr:ankyrin repeat domain-containing protein [uncultured Campylobacter sp.]